MLTVRLTDHASPRIMRALAVLKHPGAMQAAGQGVVVALRQHFRDLDVLRANRRGWARLHFWSAFARRVSLGPTTATRAVVHIQDPQGALRHKLSGGVVRPKRGRLLAIPLTSEARKKASQARIRDAFPDARVVVTPKGKFIVRTVKRGRRSISEFLFVLKASVRHQPEPGSLPSEAVLGRAAATGAGNWIARNGVD